VSRVKVLLVDDVELFLELEKTFFRQGEYTVLTAGDGVEAWRLIREERPDAVFLDLYLPGLDGDEICRRVKQDPQLQAMPVLMVTQSGRPEDLQRCRDAGCDDILLKPVNRHHFIEAARRCIRTPERAAPRVQVHFEIRFGVDAEHLLPNYVVNLSTGGLFVETESLLPVDTPLELEFELPGEADPVHCHGRVAWVNHPEWIKKGGMPVGMGVQFTDISWEGMDLIRRFVREKTLAPRSPALPT